jgi:hypothetical protein
LKDPGSLAHWSARLPGLNSEHFHGSAVTLNVSGLFAHCCSTFPIDSKFGIATISPRYAPKTTNPNNVSLRALAIVNIQVLIFPPFSPLFGFDRRIANADKINGTIITSVIIPINPLLMASVPEIKAESVRINKVPTTILPLTCSNVFSSMPSEGPSTTSESKIYKTAERLTNTASYGMYVRIFREQLTI